MPCSSRIAEAQQPGVRSAWQSAIPADEQRDVAAPEASAINNAAVAAYELGVQAGNPLSERKLAQMFGRTSRRWAGARIVEARRISAPALAANG
jgi:transposase